MTPEQQEALAAFEAARRRFHNRGVRIEIELDFPQIEQLRELMDNLPLNPYGPLVVAVLKALPLDSRGSLPENYRDTPPTVNIAALTDKGKAAMPALIKLLGPHL